MDSDTFMLGLGGLRQDSNSFVEENIRISKLNH